jgi:putative nucleotidyltransferase with HDIG domain
MNVVISAEQLQEELESLVNLPTLPGVVHMVGAMVEDDSTSTQDVSDLISKDHVLSAKVLRLVNSPFYGFPGRISSVNHATVLLGLNVVKGLLLSTAVFDTLAEESKGLWEHSLGTAVLSRALAKALGQRDPEEMMVAGLLHDLGKVIFFCLAEEDYTICLERARAEHSPIREIERAHFGFDHTAVASWAAERWNLPPRLSCAMRYHHRPSSAPEHAETAGMVHLADTLARAMEYGDGGDPTLPPMDHEAFRALGLPFDMLPEVLGRAHREFQRGIDLFRGGG